MKREGTMLIGRKKRNRTNRKRSLKNKTKEIERGRRKSEKDSGK